jgi:hypothetical protein
MVRISGSSQLIVSPLQNLGPSEDHTRRTLNVFLECRYETSMGCAVKGQGRCLNYFQVASMFLSSNPVSIPP